MTNNSEDDSGARCPTAGALPITRIRLTVQRLILRDLRCCSLLTQHRCCVR